MKENNPIIQPMISSLVGRWRAQCQATFHNLEQHRRHALVCGSDGDTVHLTKRQQMAPFRAGEGAYASLHIWFNS